MLNENRCLVNAGRVVSASCQLAYYYLITICYMIISESPAVGAGPPLPLPLSLGLGIGATKVEGQERSRLRRETLPEFVCPLCGDDRGPGVAQVCRGHREGPPGGGPQEGAAVGGEFTGDERSGRNDVRQVRLAHEAFRADLDQLFSPESEDI